MRRAPRAVATATLCLALTLGGIACGRYGPPVRQTPRPAGAERTPTAPAPADADEDASQPSPRR